MKPIAEVIESSTRRVIAECTQRKDRPPIALPPPFGSLVIIEGDPEILAVVSSISSSGYDPNRPATALGLSSYEEAHLEYPELSELLITQIELIPVGYASAQDFIQGIPPIPPPLHAGVRNFPTHQMPKFLKKLHFLRLLYDAPAGGNEELLIGTLLRILQGAPEPETRQEWLIRIGQELARLLNKDYDRLKYIMERIGT